MPGRYLHRRESSERTFDATLAFGIGEPGHAKLSSCVGIQQQRRPAFAGGLLGATIGIIEQARQRAREWKWW
jgi:hypothetical protein